MGSTQRKSTREGFGRLLKGMFGNYSLVKFEEKPKILQRLSKSIKALYKIRKLG